MSPNVRNVLRISTIIACVVATCLAPTSTAQALSSTASGIDTLNYYRGLAGTGTIGTDTSSWNTGAINHSRYMVNNGTAVHSEDASNPWYTPDGNAAGSNGVVSWTSLSTETDRSLVESLINAPFHATELLAPQLHATSFGSYRSASGSAATLDTLRGTSQTAPSNAYTFPANGATVPLTTASTAEWPNPLASCGFSGTAGLPIIAYLPSSPTSETASVTSNGTGVASCVYDEHTYADPSDQSATATGRAILAFYHAVVIIPRLPLSPTGSYGVTLNAGTTHLNWGFSTGGVAPNPPASLSAAYADGSLTMTWTAPTSTIAPTPTAYQIQLDDGQLYTVPGTQTGFSVSHPAGVIRTATVTAIGPSANSAPVSVAVSSASVHTIAGYWVVTAKGAVSPLGLAPFYGDMSKSRLNAPIVAATPTPSGHGYWLLGSDGGIFSFGDAAFYGSTGSIKLNSPVVGMAATPDGGGYWLVATDGGIFSFGDAAFYGSTGSIKLNKPVVDISASSTGHGYRLVATDGGIFSFGDAAFYGSTGSIKLNSPIASLASTPDGAGYWMVANDGGLFAYGTSATFMGNTVGDQAHAGGLRIRCLPTGDGYYILGLNGSVHAFGSAPSFGDGPPNQPVDLMLAN